MATEKDKSYNIEIIPFRDLSGLEITGFKVLNLFSPKRGTDTLNNTKWECECTQCGNTRIITGRVILKESYKQCGCREEKKSELDDDRIVGRGIIHAMQNDPGKFAAYIERKEEERRRHTPGHRSR